MNPNDVIREDPDLQADAKRESEHEEREHHKRLARKARRKLPFAKGSVTSERAADYAHRFQGTQRERVLGLIDLMGLHGCTDHEIARTLDMNPSTVRPRRGELVEQGAVVDSGWTRETPSGLPATVWVAAWNLDQGQREMQLGAA